MCVKMNNAINKFLLVGYNFMPQMHLNWPGFTHNAWRLFTKKKQQENKNLIYIYQTELNKACLQHNMICGAYKNLPRRATHDKVLKNQET